MVETIAERRLAGAEGEVLVIEEPELMLTPHQQRHLYELLRRYSERNQVIYSTRSPAMLDAAHHDEIVRLDRTAQGLSVRRAHATGAHRRAARPTRGRVRPRAQRDVLRHGRCARRGPDRAPVTAADLPAPGPRSGCAGHLDRRGGRQGQPRAHRPRSGRAPHSARDRFRLGSRPAGSARERVTSAATPAGRR